MTSRNFHNNDPAIHEEKHTKQIREQCSCNANAAQDTRENSICNACKHQQYQPGHASHTGNNRNNKNGEGLEGKIVDTDLEVAVVNKVRDQGLSEAADKFWRRKKKRAFRSDPSSNSIKKLKKDAFTDQDTSLATFKTKIVQAEKKSPSSHNAECDQNFPINHASHDSNALARNDIDSRFALPGPRSSEGKAANFNTIDTPDKIKKTLRLFRVVCRTLEEEKLTRDGIRCRRVDFQAAKILKDNLRHSKMDKAIIGAIPGIEVNDYFLYRMELAIVGLHRPPQNGIDYVNQGGWCLATSIVESGGYENDVSHSDTLVYVGQGGRVTSKNKEPEDQVLERGNLALKNSIEAHNPVRVIRKKVTGSLNGKFDEIYTYDGVYWVTKYWSEMGHQNKLIYKFWLKRIPDQPKLVQKIRQIEWA